MVVLIFIPPQRCSQTRSYNAPVLIIRVDADAIYTNNIPGGAFRGFGGPQGAFEAEMQVNHLAEALGMDPVEFRMRNLMDDESILSMNSKVPEGVTIWLAAQRNGLACSFGARR